MVVKNTSYPDFIDVEVLRRLSMISTSRWLTAVFCNWTIIVGAVCITKLWPHWLIYLGVFVMIGARQHALGVLVHEGVHYRIASNILLNDLLADILTGYPIMTPTDGYRSFHLAHHHMLDTADDPERITIDRFRNEWSFPMRRLKFWWFYVRDVSGLWPKPLIILLTSIWDIPGKRIRHIMLIGTMYGCFTVLFAATGHLWTFLLFWWLPLLTVFPACFRLRTVAEHSGIGSRPRFTSESVDVVSTTRTIVSNPLIRFLISPYAINYHTEHHLYPSVPYFHLAKVNKLLRANPEFALRSHETKGYRQVINELTRRV